MLASWKNNYNKVFLIKFYYALSVFPFYLAVNCSVSIALNLRGGSVASAMLLLRETTTKEAGN